jgi:hypothetical protein
MHNCGLASKNSQASWNLDRGNSAPTMQLVSTCATASRKMRSFLGAFVLHFRITRVEASLRLLIDDWEPRAQA